MCAMEPNLVEIPFFLAPEYLLKTASLRSVKHRSITLYSYFRCKSLHWSFQGPIYLPKFQLFHHHQYWFVANAPAVVFLFLVARFYIDSFVLKLKTLIHPKSSSCASYTKQPVVADVGHLVIGFSPWPPIQRPVLSNKYKLFRVATSFGKLAFRSEAIFVALRRASPWTNHFQCRKPRASSKLFWTTRTL